MAIITVNNVKFHVQELNPSGSQTIVMVSGMVSTLAQWYFTLAPVLAKKYHVLMFDLRGHGKTEKVIYGYDLTTIASDVIGLMDSKKIARAHILGYSFGAQTALKCAIQFPERFDKIVLIECPSTQHTMIHRYMKENKITDIEKVKRELPNDVLKRYNIERETAFVEGQTDKKRKFLGISMFKTFEFLCQQTTLLEDLLSEDIFPEEDLEKITSEVLLLFGKESDCLKEAERLHNHIESTSYFLKNGGHWFIMENPGDSFDNILHFLQTPVRELIN